MLHACMKLCTLPQVQGRHAACRALKPLQQQQCSVTPVRVAQRRATVVVITKGPKRILTRSLSADPWPAAPARAATLLAPECLLISVVRRQIHHQKQANYLYLLLLKCTKAALSIGHKAVDQRSEMMPRALQRRLIKRVECVPKPDRYGMLLKERQFNSATLGGKELKPEPE
jgi:hypothetical protein